MIAAFVSLYVVATICTAYGMLRGKQDARTVPPMLMSDPRQCVQGFKRLARRRSGLMILPPLTKEDHL